MHTKEIDREIRSTLKDIFEYVGMDPKDWPADATLRTYLERLINRCKEDQSIPDRGTR